jgi:hypothetical protein
MRKLIVSVVALVGVVLGVGAATASTAATFSRSPATGSPGSSITVASVTPCPANPTGVPGPRHVDVVLSASHRVFGSIQAPVNASGAWKSTLFVSRSATPGGATLGAFCFSGPQAEGTTLTYQPRDFTVTAATPVPPAAPARPVTGRSVFTG